MLNVLEGYPIDRLGMNGADTIHLMAEAMRLVNPKPGRLSRGVAGTRGTALVVNTPGSPKGCVECLGAILDALPHALSLMTGETTLH